MDVQVVKLIADVGSTCVLMWLFVWVIKVWMPRQQEMLKEQATAAAAEAKKTRDECDARTDRLMREEREARDHEREAFLETLDRIEERHEKAIGELSRRLDNAGK